jgi:hypothetical protein
MKGRALVGALAITLLATTGARAANPSMSGDFTRMMEWLSHEMAQGLAFNAGSMFDPPHEVKSRRLQPDISIGAGKMPLDKAQFPQPEVPALREMGASDIFPDSVIFPNLAMHLRAGLPARMDFSIRFANMTTPSGYKLGSGAAAKGQSNSVGFGLRKHFFGKDGLPLLGFGAHYNHVNGRFAIATKFKVDSISGFTADSPVNGDFRWDVSSIGGNFMLSKAYGAWTPFGGFGYNFTRGSVHTKLQATPNTPLISPITGTASGVPEKHSMRFIWGGQYSRGWINVFANGELKATGIAHGRAWVFHTGVNLPFEVGYKGFYSLRKRQKREQQVAIRDAVRDEAVVEEPVRRKRRPAPVVPWTRETRDHNGPELIFIQ